MKWLATRKGREQVSRISGRHQPRFAAEQPTAQREDTLLLCTLPSDTTMVLLPEALRCEL